MIRAGDDADVELDANPRPSKRPRHDYSDNACLPSSDFDPLQCISPVKQKPGPPVSSSPRPSQSLRRLPSSTLLLSLPGLLVHPRGHPMYRKSLVISLNALRRCLALPNLEAQEECRACVGLVEVGMSWLELGVVGDPCISLGEIEGALTKALTISQKHPSLRGYTPYLSILSARLSYTYQGNTKFAIATLKKLISSHNTSKTPSHLLIHAHLELVHILSQIAAAESDRDADRGVGGSGALEKCLVAIQAMRVAAEQLDKVNVETNTNTNSRTTKSTEEHKHKPRHRHNLIVLLTAVIKLQLLVRHGMWSKVGEALEDAEALIEPYLFSPPTPAATSSDPSTPKPKKPSSPGNIASPTLPTDDDQQHSTIEVPPTLRTHLLTLSVLYHTYAGDGVQAGERLKTLHGLLDTGALEHRSSTSTSKISSSDSTDTNMTALKDSEWNEGVIEIPFPPPPPHGPTPNVTLTSTPIIPPLRIRTTPPQVLHILAFLLSAVAKRDAVGRAPKKGVFAKAGLEEVERLLDVEKELKDLLYISLVDYFLCDLLSPFLPSGCARCFTHEIAYMSSLPMPFVYRLSLSIISTMRSDFTAAQSTLDTLISHLRSKPSSSCLPSSSSASSSSSTAEPQPESGGDLWESYAPRVCLLHAQLAHARGDLDEARKGYEVARWVASGSGGQEQSSERGIGSGSGSGPAAREKVGRVRGKRDEWVEAAAWAGDVWIRIGLLRRRQQGEEGRRSKGKGKETVEVDEMMRKREEDKLRSEAENAARMCDGHGAALQAVGEVLRACIGEEVVRGKQHLHTSLTLATKSQDNHLRALVLALSASHYIHTARGHALTMLGTCAQLAAGLGANPKGNNNSNDDAKGKAKAKAVGNAPLAMWVGERVMELYRLEGEVDKARRQEVVNEGIRKVLEGWGNLKAG
ncbi:hypothetical protein H0H93_012204 [Arthromyces matolae]|nr:hypothetical protein H0H93_012204 [Arthromyces matolae]